MSQLSISGRIVEQLELNENFSSQRKRFLQAGADLHAVDAAFQQFKQLKDKGLLSLEQKDIDRYGSLEELQQVLSSLSAAKTKTQQKREQKVAGAELVYEDENNKIYHITTWEAAKLYGKGTKWCISGDTPDSEAAFNSYKNRNTIYIAVKTQTGAKRAVLVQGDGDTVVYDERDKVVNMTSDMPKSAFKFIVPLPPDVESASPEDLLMYAKDIIKGRWPEAEPAIATSPGPAYRYAQYVVKGRWPEGEAAIAASPGAAFQYAKDIIKGRWPEAEPTIATSPSTAYLYAKDIIKGRWPEAEPAIATSSNAAYWYARDIIKGRWPEAEKVIMGGNYASNYVNRFIPGGKWPEEQA